MEISRKARWLGVAILVGLGFRAESSDAPIGDEIESAQFKLGRSVFDTEWVAAGAPGIPGRVGLGPLFNAASCAVCHKEGAHGRGPKGDGPVPAALVIQLQSPTTAADTAP